MEVERPPPMRNDTAMPHVMVVTASIDNVI